MRKFTALLAPFNPGEQGYNTLVLSGIDVVVPLEVDLETDPNSADEIRLKSRDGLLEAQLKAGDPDVTQDGENPLLLYRFRDVTPGIYCVELLIGKKWYQILGELHISRKGAFVQGQSFEEPSDGSPLGTPVEDSVIEDEEPPERETECTG